MFQDRKLGSNSETTAVNDMTDTEMYKNDSIGLKTLNEANKIQTLVVPGDHLRINDVGVAEYVIPALFDKSFM